MKIHKKNLGGWGGLSVMGWGRAAGVWGREGLGLWAFLSS